MLLGAAFVGSFQVEFPAQETSEESYKRKAQRKYSK